MMQMNPKYNRGDKVKVNANGEVCQGLIVAVNTGGTLWEAKGISYDIIVNSNNGQILYKNCLEENISN